MLATSYDKDKSTRIILLILTTRMVRGSGGVNIGIATGDSVGRSIVIHSPTLPEEPICLVMKLEF